MLVSSTRLLLCMFHEAKGYLHISIFHFHTFNKPSLNPSSIETCLKSCFSSSLAAWRHSVPLHSLYCENRHLYLLHFRCLKSFASFASLRSRVRTRSSSKVVLGLYGHWRHIIVFQNQDSSPFSEATVSPVRC